MKSLAAFFVGGRYQSILAAFLCAVVAFLLPPFTTPMVYAGAAIIALVTLNVGILQGLQTLFLATVLVGLFYSLFGIPVVAMGLAILFMWLPCWIASVVLLKTVKLDIAIMSGALLGFMALAAMYLVLSDPVNWWLAQLQQFEVVLEKKGLVGEGLTAAQAIEGLARLMTGILIASLLLGTLAGLILGRWWQGLLVNPGGLKKEFYNLRFSRVYGYLTLAVMVAGQFGSAQSVVFTAQLAMIMLVPYLFAGLAVIHGLVAGLNKGKGLLVGVYILLAIAPQMSLLLAGGGLLDTWVDFRRRLGAA
jgi:hypothetical protein